MTTADADWFARLVGVRSSKRSYYSEYRHTVEGLDRSIRALEPVSRALSTLADGPQALAGAVVRALLEILDAPWSALCVDHPALEQRPFLVVADGQGVREGTAAARAVLGLPPGAVAELPSPPAGPHLLVEELRWQGRPCGWLAAPVPSDRVGDDTDAAVLRTLGHQTAVALQNSWLYAESERLAAAATAAYEEMARHARDLDARNQELRRTRDALAAAREQSAVAEERQRIARELHDTVAQRVLTIGMNVEWCRARTAATAAPDPDLVDRLGLAKELARDTVTEIRQAIFRVSALSEPQPGGLPAALRRLVADDRGDTGPAVSLRVLGRPADLPPRVERGLYLIAREALFNVSLHASATRCAVRLSYGRDRIRLSVSDDGAGDPEQLRRHLRRVLRRGHDGHHCGLSNMATRAQELGGRLTVGRGLGPGVRIAAVLETGDA